MKTISVAAAVIYSEYKILATIRGHGKYKGKLEFPSVKIEDGETSQEALIRKIKEELNAEIEVGALIETIEYDYDTFHISMDCLWCKVKAGEFILKEAESFKWLTKEELDSVQWLPAVSILIDKINNEMPSKYYYEVGKKQLTEYASCRIEIKWNVFEITKEENANGYIVQHFSRTEIGSKRIIEDVDYFEAWRVLNGKCEGAFDDAYAVSCVAKDDLMPFEYLAEGLKFSAGNNGAFEFQGIVYWVPMDDILFDVVDSWPEKENKQAGVLKSVMRAIEFENRQPCFIRKFKHSWDLTDSKKVISIAKDLLDKAYPNNRVKLQVIGNIIAEMDIEDDSKCELNKFFANKYSSLNNTK